MKKASGEKAALVLLKVALLLLCKRAALHLCVAKGRILPCFAWLHIQSFEVTSSSGFHLHSLMQVASALEYALNCVFARFWDTRSAKITTSLPVAKKLLYAVWTPNGNEVVVTTSSNVNMIVDVRKEAIAKNLSNSVEVKKFRLTLCWWRYSVHVMRTATCPHNVCMKVDAAFILEEIAQLQHVSLKVWMLEWPAFACIAWQQVIVDHSRRPKLTAGVCLWVQVNQAAISPDGRSVLQGLGNGHIAVSLLFIWSFIHLCICLFIHSSLHPFTH